MLLNCSDSSAGQWYLDHVWSEISKGVVRWRKGRCDNIITLDHRSIGSMGSLLFWISACCYTEWYSTLVWVNAALNIGYSPTLQLNTALAPDGNVSWCGVRGRKAFRALLRLLHLVTLWRTTNQRSCGLQPQKNPRFLVHQTLLAESKGSASLIQVDAGIYWWRFSIIKAIERVCH